MDNLSSRLEYLVNSKLSSNWAELARKSGLTPSTIQQIKDGGDARGNTLLRISNALQISIDWLLTGEGEMYRKETGNNFSEFKPILIWLEQWWENADEKQRHWLEIQMKRCFPEYEQFQKSD